MATRDAQESLFHESLADALGSAIAAAGGFKRVAGELWPSRKPESAYARLKACLDDSKPENLTLDEIVRVSRLAHEAGSHVVMAFLAAELGYAEPQPVSPRDELAEREARIERKVDDLMRELGGLKRSRLRGAAGS